MILIIIGKYFRIKNLLINLFGSFFNIKYLISELLLFIFIHNHLKSTFIVWFIDSFIADNLLFQFLADFTKLKIIETNLILNLIAYVFI